MWKQKVEAGRWRERETHLYKTSNKTRWGEQQVPGGKGIKSFG